MVAQTGEIQEVIHVPVVEHVHALVVDLVHVVDQEVEHRVDLEGTREVGVESEVKNIDDQGADLIQDLVLEIEALVDTIAMMIEVKNQVDIEEVDLILVLNDAIKSEVDIEEVQGHIQDRYPDHMIRKNHLKRIVPDQDLDLIRIKNLQDQVNLAVVDLIQVILIVVRDQYQEVTLPGARRLHHIKSQRKNQKNLRGDISITNSYYLYFFLEIKQISHSHIKLPDSRMVKFKKK